MDSFETLVTNKAREGDSDWLASKLIELDRINTQLASANQELRSRIDRLETALINARKREEGNRSTPL